MIFTRLQEAGFTGEITDKIGRKVRFEDGKRVKSAVEKVVKALSPAKETKPGHSDLPSAGKPATPGGENQVKQATFDPDAHFSKAQQDYISSVLGTSQWVFRPVINKDLNKLDALMHKVKDPKQKKALEVVGDRAFAAMKKGLPAFIPAGVIKSVPRGVQNTVPITPKPGPLQTFSALTHRSPVVKVTDKPRPEGGFTYSNIIHNQIEPNPEEWKSLKSEIPNLTPDQLFRLGRKFGLKFLPYSNSGKRQILTQHIDAILSRGAKATGQFDPQFRKDTRASRHRDTSFTQFQPK